MTPIVPTSRSPLAGVVITYHPDDAFRDRLAAIAREVDRLIVVDNSAEAAAAARLHALCAMGGAQLVTNQENRGLAAALNQAFALLAEEGFVWVIAFDQDSTPLPGFAAALTAATLADPTAAVIGANWRDEGRPDFLSRHLRRHPAFRPFFQRPSARDNLGGVTCVITSGALFHLPAWHDLGGFDEALFLDLVDTDYCLRAGQSGRTIRVAAEARLLHRRGNKRAMHFLGRAWWPAFMPPLRLRYLFRNRVRLFRRHAWHAPHWVMFELAYAGKILAEILFLEDQKIAKLGACARGTWDGLLDRNGPIAQSRH